MIKAKKKYGQNFLKDQDAISKIIEAIPNNKNKIVDGIKVASCENSGCGGSSSYCPYPGKRDLLMEVEKY